jgi:hypothetical protein
MDGCPNELKRCTFVGADVQWAVKKQNEVNRRRISFAPKTVKFYSTRLGTERPCFVRKGTVHTSVGYARISREETVFAILHFSCHFETGRGCGESREHEALVGYTQSMSVIEESSPSCFTFSTGYRRQCHQD